MKMEIEDAQLHDLNIINNLLRISKGYWGYDKAFLDKFIQKLGVTEDYLKNNPVKLFYVDNVLIGFYSFIIENNKPLVLDNFFLHPDYIGKGLGHELWIACCDTAIQFGFDEFILFSDPNAEDFYLRMGCIKIGEHPSPMMPNRTNPILKYKIRNS